MEKENLQKDIDKCSMELVSLISISDLKENSIIFFRINKFSEGLLGAFTVFNDRYGKIFKDKNITMMLLEDGAEVGTLNEKEMNLQGWFKKEEKRIITLS